MVAPRLQAAGIRRGDGWILRGADFAPAPGALTAVVGPNGAGKTTLLRLLVGVWEPDEGDAFLDDRPLRAIGRQRLARSVTYVPQRVSTTFPVTVAQMVAAGRFPHRGPLGRLTDEDLDAVAAALERVGLTDLAERRATTLSGGELQRALIARALTTGATTLVLDEPTASLDLAHTLDALALLRQLADDGHAIVVAIHDLAAAVRYADAVAVVAGGRLVASGPPTDVLDADRLRDVFGVRATTVDTPDGPRWLFDRLPAT